jgi:hypothetical protein
MLHDPRWDRKLDNPYRDQTIDDLHRTRDVLVRRGWIQGFAGVAGGPRCFLGAIGEVTNRNGDRAWRVIYALGFRTEDGLARFNDERGRTKEQVLQRIEDAQRILKESGSC